MIDSSTARINVWSPACYTKPQKHPFDEIYFSSLTTPNPKTPQTRASRASAPWHAVTPIRNVEQIAVTALKTPIKLQNCPTLPRPTFLIWITVNN